MIRADFLTIAEAFRDPALTTLARDALSGGDEPHADGCVAAMKYFGDELTAVLQLIAPAISAIDGMVPGFTDWLDQTKYGDDVMMLRTLLAIANKLEAMPAPVPMQQKRRRLDRPTILQ